MFKRWIDFLALWHRVSYYRHATGLLLEREWRACRRTWTFVPLAPVILGNNSPSSTRPCRPINGILLSNAQRLAGR
jgi:hypothetical protein